MIVDHHAIHDRLMGVHLDVLKSCNSTICLTEQLTPIHPQTFWTMFI